jgi:methionyl-tRNA formyltransferase
MVARPCAAARLSRAPAPSDALRTIFIGTSEFAASVLERVAGCAHRPALVVTRPDRPQGRGRHVAPPPVAVKASELSLELWQPESVNDEPTRERIAGCQPRAVVVCAFGALIKEPLLSDYELLNVHPSLLPRWRGAAPIERAIMAGDTEPIADDDDYGSLAGRLERAGGDLLVQALDQIERGERLDWRDQDDGLATYADKIAAADRGLDPSHSAAELARVVRALHPHIGARLSLADGGMLGVLRAAPALDIAPAAGPEAGSPAAVFQRYGRLLCSCADGALELLEVKPAGGRAMEAAEYIRGHSPPSG